MSEIPMGGKLIGSKVKKVKQTLREHSEEIYQEYRQTIQLAVAAGQYEVAIKAHQHLLDHIADEDGESLLSPSVDKQKVDSGQKGPVIQIGLQIGGTVPAPKQLEEATVIDVKSE